MKRRIILFLTAAMLFALDAKAALSSQPGDVSIQFVSPEKFTDFHIYGLDVPWSASFFASQISDDLKPMLNQKFPGSKLTLRFTDINLAYNYRVSGRGGRGVRVVRSPITPERMSVFFLLQDRNGRMLASGSTRVTDTSSHNALAHQRSGSELLYYEKRMLERWLKSVRPLVEPGQSVPEAAVVKIRTQGGLLAAKP
jgi:hypothetical protein